VRWAAEDRSRRVPISGTDLAEIGLSGPAIGRALGRIRSAHLDGAVANREEALALAAELARNPKLRERSTRRVRLGAAARASKPHRKSRSPSKPRSSNKPHGPKKKKKKNEAGADRASRPRPRAGRK
jgi:FXSXX-COOH protein